MTKLKFAFRILTGLILLLAGKANIMASIPDTLKGFAIEYEYAFEEAIKQFNFGNYSQSLFLFKKCLEVNSKSASSNYQVSNIYLMAGDSKNALDYARSAYLLDKSNKWISLLLIKCYQLVDRNDSAILVLEHLLKGNPENLDLMYEYGNLLANISRFGDAISCFNEIDRKIGLNEGTALARHQIFIQKHDYVSAEKELESLIKAFPDEIRYLGMLAELYSSTHNKGKAKEIYKQIFQTDSTNNLALISIADFYRDIKEYDKAFFQLNKVLERSDIQLDSKLGLLIGYLRNDSDLLLNKGRIRISIGQLFAKYPANAKIEKLLVDYFIRTNDYDSAIIVIDRFIPEEGSQDIWEQYFLLLNARNKYEKIIQQFSEAKIHAGDLTGIYIITGIANLQLMKFNDAVEVLNEGLNVKNIKPLEKAEILKYKGEALYKLQEMKKSDSCFDEVLRIDPDNYLVLNNYSFYLALRDTALEKACYMSKKVVTKFPENATYIDTYAFILMKLHKYNAAYRWMKKAIGFNINGDAEIYEHMGDILFFKGKKEEAIIFWNKAKDKGRDDISIGEKLKSLKK